MSGYYETLVVRLKAIAMLIDSGVKIKRKTVGNTLHEASAVVHKMQEMEAKLDAVGKENCELRRQLEIRVMTTNPAGDEHEKRTNR